MDSASTPVLNTKASSDCSSTRRRISRDDTATFEVLPLMRDVLRAVLHPGHPLARRRSLALRDLERTPFVLYRADFALHGHILEACRREGFTPQVAAESVPQAMHQYRTRMELQRRLGELDRAGVSLDRYLEDRKITKEKWMLELSVLGQLEARAH